MRTYYVVDPSPLTKAGEHIVSDGTMMTFSCLKPLGPLFCCYRSRRAEMMQA